MIRPCFDKQMILTTRARYAVMAVADMCRQDTLKPMSLSLIAQRNELSLSYLEQIFYCLKRGHIVKAVRGPGGGYMLARSKSDIKIADILQAIEEPIKITNCGGKKNCTKTATQCETHHLWWGLESKIYDYLNSISLVDLCR